MAEVAAAALQRPWMTVFLRLLALLYAYGAAVHYAHMLGVGPDAWPDVPRHWKVADVAYAALDTFAAIGLWRRRNWGVLCWVLAALSQTVLYGFFAEDFTVSEEQREALSGMIGFHGITLGVFVALLWIEGKVSGGR